MGKNGNEHRKHCDTAYGCFAMENATYQCQKLTNPTQSEHFKAIVDSAETHSHSRSQIMSMLVNCLLNVFLLYYLIFVCSIAYSLLAWEKSVTHHVCMAKTVDNIDSYNYCHCIGTPFFIFYNLRVSSHLLIPLFPSSLRAYYSIHSP